MRIWSVLILTLLSVSSAACATKPVKTGYPMLKPVIANMGPGCRVKLSVPDASRYSYNYVGYTDQGIPNPSWSEGSLGFQSTSLPYWPDSWHFGLTCYQSTSTQARNNTVAFNSKAGFWVVNPSNTDILPEQHLKVYQIKTSNAQGWAYTDDDTATEFPERRMQYCVYHDERAICGHTDVGYLKSIRRHPSADRTAYVLKILNSIEFLEDAPPSENSGLEP